MPHDGDKPPARAKPRQSLLDVPGPGRRGIRSAARARRRERRVHHDHVVFRISGEDVGDLLGVLRGHALEPQRAERREPPLRNLVDVNLGAGVEREDGDPTIARRWLKHAIALANAGDPVDRVGVGRRRRELLERDLLAVAARLRRNPVEHVRERLRSRHGLIHRRDRRECPAWLGEAARVLGDPHVQRELKRVVGVLRIECALADRAAEDALKRLHEILIAEPVPRQEPFADHLGGAHGARVLRSGVHRRGGRIVRLGAGAHGLDLGDYIGVAVHAVDALAGEIHVAADLIVGVARIGLDLIEGHPEVFDHRAHEIAELPGAGLDVDARHLRGDRDEFRIEPGV